MRPHGMDHTGLSTSTRKVNVALHVESQETTAVKAFLNCMIRSGFETKQRSRMEFQMDCSMSGLQQTCAKSIGSTMSRREDGGASAATFTPIDMRIKVPYKKDVFSRDCEGERVQEEGQDGCTSRYEAKACSTHKQKGRCGNQNPIPGTLPEC